jgi:hypothetical protein
MNNINLWAWGLWGNTDKKGWELYGTEKNKIEFGGRLQLPLPKAEIGLSYHHRQGKIPADGFIILNDEIFPENRIGIDLRADLGIGLWIEDVLKHQDIDQLYNYSNMLTLGADYTFGVGNGLNMLAEHFIYQLSEDKILGNDRSLSFTAISATYNLSLTASINAIAYYDWTNSEFYRFLNLGLTYDRFSYYIMGFWNPENFRIFETRSGPSLFNGTGIQIMAVFNH